MHFSKTFTALLATALTTVMSATAIGSKASLSRRQSFTAIATYYDPDGGFGACGTQLQNSDFIVALPESQYDGGAHCGQTVNVEYQGNSIQVTVADLCPGCQGEDGIDLAEGAMAALDSNYVNDGAITVNWSFA